MCFSLEASVVSSVLLTAIGVHALQKVKNRAYMPLALIPLIFGIQQACEAVIWYTIRFDPTSTLLITAAYIFLFIAYCVWPLWIPRSIVSVEKNPQRRSILWILSALGLLVAIRHFFIFTADIDIKIGCGHIEYLNTAISQPYLWSILYLIAVVGSCFVSSMRFGIICGIALLFSCLASYVLWFNSFGSVWCFFGALLSILVYAVLIKKPDALKKV